ACERPFGLGCEPGNSGSSGRCLLAPRPARRRACEVACGARGAARRASPPCVDGQDRTGPDRSRARPSRFAASRAAERAAGRDMKRFLLLLLGASALQACVAAPPAPSAANGYADFLIGRVANLREDHAVASERYFEALKQSPRDSRLIEGGVRSALAA